MTAFRIVRLSDDVPADYIINPDDIDRMHIYVFDSKGLFLREYVDDDITFSENYFIDCSDLLPGKYSLVAWGGKDEEFYSTEPLKLIKGETEFDEALLMLR